MFKKIIYCIFIYFTLGLLSIIIAISVSIDQSQSSYANSYKQAHISIVHFLTLDDGCLSFQVCYNMLKNKNNSKNILCSFSLIIRVYIHFKAIFSTMYYNIFLIEKSDNITMYPIILSSSNSYFVKLSENSLKLIPTLQNHYIYINDDVPY